MADFIIEVPMPAMGATVSELTIIAIAVTVGQKVVKGQKLAELESDKSAFDFESPADGTVVEIKGNAGEVKSSGQSLFRLAIVDESLRHLATPESRPVASLPVAPAASAVATASSNTAAKAAVWTPRAIKMAQEAGLDYLKITGISATGPGGRVSGDDVVKYLAGKNG